MNIHYQTVYRHLKLVATSDLIPKWPLRTTLFNGPCKILSHFTWVHYSHSKCQRVRDYIISDAKKIFQLGIHMWLPLLHNTK